MQCGIEWDDCICRVVLEGYRINPIVFIFRYHTVGVILIVDDRFLAFVLVFVADSVGWTVEIGRKVGCKTFAR